MANDDRDTLPSDVVPSHYDLSLYKLDKSEFTYSGTVVIDIDVVKTTDEISLNVKELEIGEAVFASEKTKTQENYKATNVQIDKKRERAAFKFPKELPQGKASLTIQFTGVINNKLAGFYRSGYKDTNGEQQYMYSTQFESCDARQAFPVFDEPNLKATFDFSITIPQNWTALSNMPVISSKPPEDGSKKAKTAGTEELKVVKFATSPKMSSYLLAWACGDFEYVETHTERKYNGASIPVRVYTTKGLKEQGQFALKNAAQTIDYFSEIFDIDYPLPKMDMLAVHEFSHGAMENWGLVTYRTTAILYDEGKSDPRYKNRVAYVVAHELAHQWFGNLVTMDWWNELWLNEGFATWVGWLAIDHFYPDWDVWGQFVSESMQTGFNLDALRSSHPIEVPVRDALEVDQIFDSISYLKGSSVIRMLSNALGIEIFLKGVSNYLKKHQYGNARTNDLWTAVAEVSGKDIPTLMEHWIKSIGFPVLDVAEAPDTLTIRQTRFLSTGDVKSEDDQTVWWVPLGLTKETLTKDVKDDVTALNKKETSIFGLNTDFYKLNLGQNGFYKVNYPAERLEKFGQSIQKFSVADRIGLVADALSLAVSGNCTTTSLLSLLDGMHDEDNFLVWSTVAGAVTQVRRVFSVNPELKKALKKFSHKLYSPTAEKLGWEFKSDESFLTTQLRALIISAAAGAGHAETIKQAQSQFEAYFGGDKAAINPANKLPVFRIAIAEGGKAEYEKVWKEYLEASSPDGQEIALQALGRVSEPELVKDYLEKMLTTIPTQNTHNVSSSLSANSDASPILWEFIKERWDDLFKLLSGNMVLVDRFVKVTLNKFSDDKTLEELKAFFEGKDQKGYDRAVRIVTDNVQANVSWRQRDEKVLTEWLKTKGYLE